MQLSNRAQSALVLAGILGAFSVPAPAQIKQIGKEALEQEGDKKGKNNKGDARFVTAGANAWSAKCGDGAKFACKRDAEFAKWFPNGLVIGDQSGKDGNKKYSVTMRTAAEVVNVLKTEGAARTLEEDSKGAAPKEIGGLGVPAKKLVVGGGELTRNLTAAKLNLANNRGRAAKNEPGLGRHVLTGGVPAPLVGMAVRDLVDLSDKALSGAFGQVGGKKSTKVIVDVDRNGTADVSLADLSAALQTFNLGFRKGSKSFGLIAASRPTTGPAAETGDKPAQKPAIAPVEKPETPPATEPVSAPKPGEPAIGEPAENATAARTLITFTQQDWSKGEADKLQNYILQQNFSKLFPRGLLIGDPQGIDKDERFCLIFQTAKDLADFLPAKGRPGSLGKNALNPSESTAGSLAGELIAAKLNVLFDDRGFMPQGGGGKLGKQVFVDQVAKPLRGVTVLQVLRIAERTVAGEYGAIIEPPAHSQPMIDVDGDAQAGISAVELTDALNKLNKSFKNGKAHGHVFGKPAKTKGGVDKKAKGGANKKAKGRVDKKK